MMPLVIFNEQLHMTWDAKRNFEMPLTALKVSSLAVYTKKLKVFDFRVS